MMGGDQALTQEGTACPRRAVILALSAAFAFSAASLSAEPTPLTTAAEIHRLTPRESASGLPVKMRGVITYIRGIGPELTIQDATGGVSLDWFQQQGMPPLSPGQELEIEGTTAVNPPTPRVKVDRLKIVGRPGMPAPRAATMAELLTGDLEGTYVEFSALLRAVRVEDGVKPARLALEFGPAQSRLTVWVSRWDEQTREAYRPGAMVRVRGVLMRWKTSDWLPYSTFAVTHDPTWISIVKEPAPREEEPLMTIPEVLDTRPDDDVASPLRVRGVVTLDRSPQGIVIQGDGAALWVRPRGMASFTPGDLVEAIGFPGPNGARKELEDAEVRKIGHDGLPEAQLVSPGDFANRPPLWMDSQYARVRGKVRQSSVSDAGTTHWLDFGDDTLPLLLPSDGGPLPVAGTLVEATGVLEAHLNRRILQTGVGVGDYELHLQGPASLTILQPAPWWTQQRLFAALGIIVLLAGGAALWALSLRRRVVEKSAQLAREITARHDQELLAEERQRLARDLHDTLEQTLTGASLQLDAVEALRPGIETATPGEPFQLARRLLDRSRDELRRAVWDLTPGLLEQRGLPAALAVMAEEQSGGGEVNITIDCDPAAERLPDRLAAHLCRVVQEATSNAIRHGHAKQISVELKLAGDAMDLRIEDDGSGFNPAAAPGIQSGHFGVNGMKERLRRLGGNCEIHSRPGEGTIVHARCPVGSDPSPEPPGLKTLS